MSASGNNTASLRGALAGFCLVLLGATATAATTTENHVVDDLDYGQALFHFFQQNDLEAIPRLLVGELRPIHGRQRDESRLLLADLYYGYGLYEDSRELFAALLAEDVATPIQNRIWFNLARLRYDQGYPGQSRDLLARIDAELPGSAEAERGYLLTNLSLEAGDFAAAAEAGERIDDDSTWKLYARYNLAAATLQNGDEEPGNDILAEIGTLETGDSERLALRDRANLSLGIWWLRAGNPEAALSSLLRVRLDGPLANPALLASGWAWLGMDQFDKAQVPWNFLLERNRVDAATQEAILAIPTSYARAGNDMAALRRYEIAADRFDDQLRQLDDAIDAIESNELIDALYGGALLLERDFLQRRPPLTPLSEQLHVVLASRRMQGEIRRYQELLDIRAALRRWQNAIPTLELMLEERRRAFEQRLPMLRQSSSFELLAARQAQRDEYAGRVAEIERNADYGALASPAEREHLERLERVRGSLARIGDLRETSYQQDMLRVLSGLLDYQMATEFPRRLWRVRKQLIGTDRALQAANARVESLRRIAERSEADFADFAGRIDGQDEVIVERLARVDALLRRQEGRINAIAVEAIRAQQQHLVQLRLNARFELARIYDKLSEPPQ